MSTTAPERPGRRQGSFGGMAGALLVLLLGIAAFMTLREVSRVDLGDPVRAVDLERPARFAQEAARFEVLAPATLPEGWIATSVRFEEREPQSWHVGLLTDERAYVGVEQAERPVAAMVADFVDEEAVQGEPVEVGGARWIRFSDPGRDPGADPATDPEGDLALVREDADVTTLVVGTVSQDELSDFVAALR